MKFAPLLVFALFLTAGCLQQNNQTKNIGIELRGITEEFPPYNYMSSFGNITGLSTELVHGLAKRTNQTVSLELTNFSDGYNIVLTEPNTFFYSLGRTPQRESLFKWVGPIGSWELTLYTTQDSNRIITKLEDAKTASKICVVKDDVRYQLLLDNNFTNLLVVSEDIVCSQKLAAREVELWFGSSTSFSRIISSAGLNPDIFKALYMVQKNDLYIGFNKNTSDVIVTKWQTALDKMKADGTFNAIVNSETAE